MLCDGSAVSRSTYADLFAVISTTYGSGDGSSTFNVPDLQGKFPQGKDGSNNLAGTGGANTVTVSVTNNQAATNATNQAVTVTGSISNTSLTEAQLAQHAHNMPLLNQDDGLGFDGAQRSRSNPQRNAPTANAGSGTGHNHSHTLSGTLTGNITTSLTGTVTAAGTNSFSPFVVTQYIIKH